MMPPHREHPSTQARAGAALGDREVARLGRDFVFSLHAATRALKLYPLENQAVQKALEELDSDTRQIGAVEPVISLRYVGDFCFVNELRLRIDLTTYGTFGAVRRLLNRHDIGQIEVEPETTLSEWTAFLSLLLAEPAAADPFTRVQERLEGSVVRHIRIAPMTDAPPERLPQESREAARRAYEESVAVARDTMLGVRMGRGVSVRRVKRTVQKIVDQVLNNESSMMGMTALRDYDQYTFAHSVNVCIFSIALGKKLDLSRDDLYELGMGALMHDMGKVRLPIELTTKSGVLGQVEWELIREHPTEGLLALMELSRIGELPLRAMLMAYEHHMKIDQTGYPRSIRPREPSLFSRIVAIADGFDAATTKRTYQSDPWLPDAVLREMRDNSARGFDPLLVKAFISLTGFYPVGSVVILDSFELAVVIAPSTRPDRYNQPVVRIIFDEMGIPLSPPRTLDLTETDRETGAPLRTIIKTTDPERYGIDVRHYIA
jgi:HD-GYP domain-containing protein (c-di-GMP phosphodiesterase class II)